MLMIERSNEELAIDTLLRASERKQAAYFSLLKQLSPRGDGLPTRIALDEMDAAEADWKVANSEVERIADEIKMDHRP